MPNIPIKPQEVTWTDEQWQAIWAKGQDTLVSAAAGSGKTAVLIERLIQKVIDETNPMNVDELLVVTFTNASAAEMRQRMAAALEKAVKNNPESQHLRRQLTLINKAQISTLHSFCLNIVRQYAYLLNIDPGFRIANENEAALLKDDTMAEVLEAAYDVADPSAMYRLVDAFTSDRNDQDIEVLIEKLYEMARVNPQPFKWLDALPERYNMEDVERIDDLSIIQSIRQTMSHSVDEAIALILEMRALALMPDGPDAYGETAEMDLTVLYEARAFINERSWQEAYEFFSTFKWGKLKSQKKGTCDESLLDRAKAKRNDAKKVLADATEQFFSRHPDRLLEEMQHMYPLMQTLVELAKQFSMRYSAAKAEKGIVDFSDLEHFALAILTTDEDGEVVPSDVAKDYQARFKEVLVDEYQDTNRLQETILQLVKSGTEADGNLFMVGDTKQSIYRFRLAEPALFLGKYRDFTTTGDAGGLKIDLNANFRSRREVLDGTNYIFKQIMTEEVGEIDYDDAAALKPRAPYPTLDMPVTVSVLHAPELEEEADTPELEAEEEMKKSQLEARYIIRQIQQLMNTGAQVYDAYEKDAAGNPVKRDLEYRDIVILMRSMTWSNDFVEEFKLAGIPLYAELSAGYFEELEVMIMMNTLRIIDNPYQDIPLASVLRAPFVGMTENDLAAIRLAEPKGAFYDALKTFVLRERSGLHAKTAEKLQRFLLQFDDWRDLARRGSLAELIWQVYMDTNYYEMAGAMSNGKQRQANLRALYDRAVAYEKTAFRGLFRFLRFVDRIRLRGEDLGTAKAISQSENVVRLMTIHASKGLEFPYVFVAGLGRSFNKMDFHLPYLFDQDFGLAVKMIDPEKRLQYTSLPFLAVKEKKLLEMKSEEMRILYVAMTRAKEKLYLVGHVKDWETTQVRWQEMLHLSLDEPLPPYVRRTANSYFDWIGPAVARHADYQTQLSLPLAARKDEPSRFDIQIVDVTQFQAADITEEATDVPQTVVEQPLLTRITETFDTPYPYKNRLHKRSKASVSELKRLQTLAQQELPEIFNDTKASSQRVATRPRFMQQRTMTAAEAGTAMHTVMQHAPQQGFKTIAEVASFVEKLVDKELLTPSEGKTVYYKNVLSFFDTNIGHVFQQAKSLHRELPFTYRRADEDGDDQIVQGIIDCLIETTDGEWILLDYKTDHLQHVEDPESVLRDRYAVQLDIYTEAIEHILSIRIAQKVIYAFDIAKTVVL
ncbi:helicase-exonuclease AddAB subunit AddA [Kurthia massiliensis]|uniref:helicase-exonuclease AddAB subunit AddA n=1 Tax=Kurthia massiliensis TaxID=1033739 RepID=UPI0002892AB0|nr:helicase-exonuclease AddAB subunit AddA [Kurthia massiliensis]